MFMKQPDPFIILAVGISLYAANIFPARAQELPETVISASRTKELAEDSPYSIDIIPADELLNEAIRTLPEALRNTPGVMIQKTTHGHGSPYIRGFTGRQNLLLVDGVRVNNSTFRRGPVQYWNTVDSSAINRLELVKGQGSVLYGSDAVGGTLNTLTRSSNFREYATEWFNESSLGYRVDTNSRSQVGRVETAFGQGGHWGLLLGVSAKDFGDIKDAAIGRMKNTGYKELDLDLRLDFALSADISMTLAHHHVDQDDVWRWHSTIYNSGWTHGSHVTTPGTYNARILDQERSLTYLKLAGGEGGGLMKRWSAVLSFQKSQDSQFQDRSPADIRWQSIDLETWGLAVQMESEIGAGDLLYGLDYYHDCVDSWGARTGKDPRSQRPIADDSSYDLFGVFAQYRWTPFICLPKLETTLGVRYTHADAQLGKTYDSATGNDISADKSWDNWVFSGRALYDINDCWNLFAGVSQGFRAPNLNDLSGNLTTRSGLTSLGSLDLEPEKFITYEIGGRCRIERFRFSASAYYTEIESVITGVPATLGSDTIVTANGQDGYVYGVEAEAGIGFGENWEFTLQASWQEGQTSSDLFIGGPQEDDYISRLAPLMGSASLRWSNSGNRLWVEGRVSAAAEADKLSARDQSDTQRIPTGGTPSYVIASIYAGWKATENLFLTLGLENLTDEDYRIHGSGQNEAGINATLGVKIDF